MIEQTGLDYFFGVVEDIDDPLKCGRVRVRVLGLHTNNKKKIPTEKLKWWHCGVNNSAAISGKGETPSGYVKGSWVFGFFLDKEKQEGIVAFAINGIPEEFAKTMLGFYDPTGEFPLYINEPDYNKLGRGNKEHWVHKTRESVNVGSITSADGVSWEEPQYENNAEYPFNHVKETLTHVEEFDDTKGSERYHRIHPSGSYEEVTNDHRTVVVIGQSYRVIHKDDNVLIKGNCNVTIEGDCNIKVNGNRNEEIAGDYNLKVSGNINSSASFYNHNGDSKFTGNHRQEGGISVANDVETDAGITLNKHKHLDSMGGNCTPPIP